MEGFICPKCHESFTTSKCLLSHFSRCNEESNSNDNNNIINEGIKNLESLVIGTNVSKTSNSQTSIYIKNNTKDFETLRSIYNTDNKIISNRTILRMRKILSISTDDLGFRKSAKDLEQEIVEWDMLSINCYICNGTFNLFRRRHHCRTCGCAICGNCMRNLNSKDIMMADDLFQSEKRDNSPMSDLLRPTTFKLCIKCFNIIIKKYSTNNRGIDFTDFLEYYDRWFISINRMKDLIDKNYSSSNRELSDCINSVDRFNKSFNINFGPESDHRLRSNQAIQKIIQGIEKSTKISISYVYEKMTNS